MANVKGLCNTLILGATVMCCAYSSLSFSDSLGPNGTLCGDRIGQEQQSCTTMNLEACVLKCGHDIATQCAANCQGVATSQVPQEITCTCKDGKNIILDDLHNQVCC